MSDLKNTSIMSASSFALSDSLITSDRGSPGLDSSSSSGSSDSYLTCESQLDHGVLYPFSIDNMMFGCANLGNLKNIKSEMDAIDLVIRAYQQGIRNFHVSALYGGGLAEIRLGKALKILKKDYGVNLSKGDIKVYITVGETLCDAPCGVKVPDIFKSPLFSNVKYSYDKEGVLNSFSQSLNRLNLRANEICGVFVHDLDLFTHKEKDFNFYLNQYKNQGGYESLYSLKKKHDIKIGLGTRDTIILKSFISSGHKYNNLMLQGGYTLIEDHAFDSILPVCMLNDIRVVIAGPFSSGLLADPGSNNWHHHKDITPGSCDYKKASIIKNICDESSVSIKQAALQYPLTHPAIDMCCVGSDDIHQLMENVEYIQAPFLGIDFYEQVLTIDIEKEYTPVAQLCFNLPFYDCDEDNLKEAVL